MTRVFAQTDARIVRALKRCGYPVQTTGKRLSLPPLCAVCGGLMTPRAMAKHSDAAMVMRLGGSLWRPRLSYGWHGDCLKYEPLLADGFLTNEPPHVRGGGEFRPLLAEEVRLIERRGLGRVLRR